MAITNATAEAQVSIERLYRLSELAELGYGSRTSNLRLIAAGKIPAVRVGQVFKIRESDLPRLAIPVDPTEAMVCSR